MTGALKFIGILFFAFVLSQAFAERVVHSDRGSDDRSYSGGDCRTIQSGIASEYGTRGAQPAAAGGWMNPRAMTAAHKTLPFGTVVRVVDKRNHRMVSVRINDRGPYVAGRVIDLTPAAARQLDMDGLAPVDLQICK